MLRRPVGKQRSRLFMVTVGIAGIAVAALTFYVGYQAAYTVPGRSYYDLHAEFENAENLANHYEIRMDGVRVGQVLNPRVRDGHALVDLRIDAKYKPLRSDTKLRIRLRSAIGVRYLEIIPGRKGEPLADGATIPAANTATPVALDKVLGVFDPKTRTRTRELLNQLGAGTSSRGPDVNEALATAPGFLEELSSVSAAIVDRPGAMSRFVSSAEGAADAVDPVRDDIAEGFAPEARALAPLVDARKEVQATLRSVPPTLSELDHRLPAVTRMVDSVGRLARDGAPALRAAPPALGSTRRLLAGASAPLDNAEKTLELASDAVPPTLKLLRTVEPALPSLDQTLGSLIPTLDEIAPRACDLTQFATGWAEYLKWGDSYSSFIRFLIAAGRPEQPAGQTSKFSKLPTANGRDAYDGFVNSAPYPERCVNGVSAAGFEQPTVDESIRGETYGPDNMPGSR